MPAITNTLRPIYFSRNAVPLALDLPNSLGTPGVKAQRTLLFNSATANGNSFTIAWEWEEVEYSVTFAIATTPDADDYEIAPGSGQAYAESVVQTLLGHPLIWQFFDVAYASAADPDRFGFRLISRVVGPIELSTPAPTGFTWVVPLNIAGVAPTFPPDYLASLWVAIGREHDTPTHQFERIGELELLPDAQGKAHTDVAEILDAFLTQPELPTDTTAAPVLCTAVQRRFYIALGEKYGDPVERSRQVLTAPITLLKGGIAPHDYASLAGGADTLVTAQFLTLRPVREVCADQKDWLYFVGRALDPGREHALLTTITYTDGTTHSGGLWSSDAILSGKVYQCAAGFIESGVQALALLAQPTKQVSKYTLELNSVAAEPPNVPLLAPITFYLARPDYLALHFEYENTLSAVESWCMRGVRALTGSHTHTPYRLSRTKPADSEGATGVAFEELLSYNERDELAITFSTAPMSPTDGRAFRDFLRSRHKWMRRGTHRVPFRVDPGDYALDQETLDANYLRQHSFRATLPPSMGVSDIIPLFA